MLPGTPGVGHSEVCAHLQPPRAQEVPVGYLCPKISIVPSTWLVLLFQQPDQR